jgi:transketolase
MLQPSSPPRQLNSNPAAPSLGERPINWQTPLSDAVRDTHGRLVIAEDHRPEGGLGSALLEALAARNQPHFGWHLVVRVMPRSGTPTELLAAAAIDAASIERAARRLLDGSNGPSPGCDAPASTPHH